MQGKIWIIALVVLMTGCSLIKKFNLEVVNRFPMVDHPGERHFSPWNNDDFFILRVSMTKDYLIEGQPGEAGELSDFPMKNFELLEDRGVDRHDIVEEVYLYLDGWTDSSAHNGQAIYMTCVPLEPGAARLMYCNESFVSTYSINHVMTGEWWMDEGELYVKVIDNGNRLILKGGAQAIKNQSLDRLEFKWVSHPKPMSEKGGTDLIPIGQVFKVGESESIHFFNGHSRILVHPDWGEFSNRFNYQGQQRYYSNHFQERRISAFYVPTSGSEDHRLYLLMRNSDPTGAWVFGYD